MRDITWIMLRHVTQQIPGRYLCCKSICSNIIFSRWEKTETQYSVLVDTKVLYPTTLPTLFGKQFLLRLTDMNLHWSQKRNTALAVFNHPKPSYKQSDILFHVYILRHILNGLIDTGCMQSKLTVSYPSFLVWFILVIFILFIYLLFFIFYLFILFLKSDLLRNGLNRRCLMPFFGTFKMPFLIFISILVFRPKGQIWNPVRRDTMPYVRRILNAYRISKNQLNFSTIRQN